MIAPTPIALPQACCGWRHMALDAVASTNDIALQQAAAGAEEGLVITARQQSHGRGRQGRDWYSDHDDCLLMSILLRPSWLTVAEAPQLSLLASLALYNALEIEGKQIKWPNDLLVHGNKLAGILTELRTPAAKQPPIVVVGIGVNLRTPSDGWPSSLRTPATALSEMGISSSAHSLMLAIVHAFDHLYACFRDGGFAAIADGWWQAHGGERAVSVDDGSRCWSGTAVGLDHDGALLVRNDQGVERVVAADISLTKERDRCY